MERLCKRERGNRSKVVARGNTKSQYCLDLFEKEFKKNMLEWAKQEIELACKLECGDRPKDEFDYGCACYESALKAFKSLLWPLLRALTILKFQD